MGNVQMPVHVTCGKLKSTLQPPRNFPPQASNIPCLKVERSTVEKYQFPLFTPDKRDGGLYLARHIFKNQGEEPTIPGWYINGC